MKALFNDLEWGSLTADPNLEKITMQVDSIKQLSFGFGLIQSSPLGAFTDDVDIKDNIFLKIGPHSLFHWIDI